MENEQLARIEQLEAELVAAQMNLAPVPPRLNDPSATAAEFMAEFDRKIQEAGRLTAATAIWGRDRIAEILLNNQNHSQEVGRRLEQLNQANNNLEAAKRAAEVR